MLKGVSQNVIEVVHTDNRYFEKAILFLRPDVHAENKAQLKERAGEYLSQIDYDPTGRQPQKKSMSETLKTIIAGLVGAAIACLFFLL